MIELSDVNVVIPAHVHHTDRDLRRTVAKALLGGHTRVDKGGDISIVPLRNVSFHVKSGERVGVLGLNGAGKTTLLKTIAQVYPIHSGSVRTHGNIRSFFNLGAGLDPLRSGFENVELVSMYYTRDKKRIESARPEIIDFAALGEFIHLPVSTYSSGMLTRLLFAIATQFDAEILLLDEWIGAGDATFIDKANKRLNRLMEKAGCMVLASHSFPLIKQLCDRALWLERGQLRMYGPVDEVVGAYNEDLTKLYEAQAS